MVRCRLQHSEGAPGRALHSGNIGVCDIRDAAVRERAASTAGNRPLFYFRFGERTPLRETPGGASRGRPSTCRRCRRRGHPMWAHVRQSSRSPVLAPGMWGSGRDGGSRLPGRLSVAAPGPSEPFL